MCNQRVVECFRTLVALLGWGNASYDLCGHNLLAVSFDDVLFEHITHIDTETDIDTRIRTCVIIYLLMSVQSVQVGESVRTRTALCSLISDWPVRANRNQNSRKDGADERQLPSGRTDKAILDDGKWAAIKFFLLNFELIFARPQATVAAAVAGKCKAKGQQRKRGWEQRRI